MLLVMLRGQSISVSNLAESAGVQQDQVNGCLTVGLLVKTGATCHVTPHQTKSVVVIWLCQYTKPLLKQEKASTTACLVGMHALQEWPLHQEGILVATYVALTLMMALITVEVDRITKTISHIWGVLGIVWNEPYPIPKGMGTTYKHVDSPVQKVSMIILASSTTAIAIAAMSQC